MDGLDKHRMILDLYEEFSTFLHPSKQIALAKDFSDIIHWEKRLDRNTLMYSVRVNNLDQDCIYDEEVYERWKQQKALLLKKQFKLKDEEAMLLINEKIYFGNMRNYYTHLLE